ncbi:MAG: hypothetical protein ABIB43_03280 [archaeon]
MKRKVIKQGASSLTISLPTKWTKKFKIESGDEVEVDDAGKDLLISTGHDFSSKKTTIDVSGLSLSMIRNYINAVYIRGDDEVNINFNNQETMELIQDSVNHHIGFAIVQQQKNSCLIKDLSGTTSSEFDNILKRVFYMIISFGEEGLELIKKQEPLKDFWKRDLTINKYIYYSLRMLNKKGHPEFEKTEFYYNILILLEHLADEYSRLYGNLKTPKLSPKTIKIFEEVNKMFKDFFEVFYKFDKLKADNLVMKRRKIRESLLDTKNNNDLIVTYSLRKIAELITDILQIQLQLVL